MEQDTHLKTVQSTINITNNIINFKLNMGTLPATVEDFLSVDLLKLYAIVCVGLCNIEYSAIWWRSGLVAFLTISNMTLLPSDLASSENWVQYTRGQ